MRPLTPTQIAFLLLSLLTSLAAGKRRYGDNKIHNEDGVGLGMDLDSSFLNTGHRDMLQMWRWEDHTCANGLAGRIAGDIPGDSIWFPKNRCTTFDSAFGSFKFQLPESGLLDNCTLGVWETARCTNVAPRWRFGVTDSKAMDTDETRCLVVGQDRPAISVSLYHCPRIDMMGRPMAPEVNMVYPDEEAGVEG